MHSPAGEPPFDTHCRLCGAELIVRSNRKRRVGILDRHSEWGIDTVCSGCGDEYGGTVSQIIFGSPSRTVRVLRLLRRSFSRIPFVNRLRRRRHAPEYSRADGSVDVLQLVAAMPFKVYGMNGNPLGLRLVSFGHGSKGRAIKHIHFSYTAGSLHLRRRALGARVVDLRQGPLLDYLDMDVEALGSIRGIADRSADFHRHWNLNRIERAPRREVKASIDGVDAVVELTLWQDVEIQEL